MFLFVDFSLNEIINFFVKISCNFLYVCVFYFRYPEELAWQMKLSRVTIRSSEGLRKLHNFLVSETETVSKLFQIFLHKLN